VVSGTTVLGRFGLKKIKKNIAERYGQKQSLNYKEGGALGRQCLLWGRFRSFWASSFDFIWLFFSR